MATRSLAARRRYDGGTVLSKRLVFLSNCFPCHKVLYSSEELLDDDSVDEFSYEEVYSSTSYPTICLLKDILCCCRYLWMNQLIYPQVSVHSVLPHVCIAHVAKVFHLGADWQAVIDSPFPLQRGTTPVSSTVV